MADLLQRLNKDLANWTSLATTHGWLRPSDADALADLSTATAADLFNQQRRPLVVGLFGGTGVGKSTLLNRFAADTIARTSAERPTSRRVTLYVHSSVTVDHLPAEFPVDDVQIAIHHNADYASVLWIDMPDFDSVETHNRELVEHWLPHIDVLLYVASPERYRDDAGWRLLLQHGHRHAWIFVLNHWDRGVPEQRTDFLNQLTQAGLTNPVLYCTDSSSPTAEHEPASEPDDFDKLRQHVTELANSQLIEQLEARGVMQRSRDLQRVADTLRQRTGPQKAISATQQSWHTRWQEQCTTFRPSIDMTMRQISARHVNDDDGSLPKRFVGLFKKESTLAAPVHDAESGDSYDPLWASGRELFSGTFNDYLQQCKTATLQVGVTAGVPQRPLQATLNQATDKLDKLLGAEVDVKVHESLLSPGSPITRHAHRLLGWATWLLPLMAMSWIAYRVVTVFWAGGQAADYLGANFATHSGMLLGLAWLLPTWLHMKCKPSRVAAAHRGLQQGYDGALDHLQERIDHGFGHLKRQHAALLKALDAVFANAAAQSDINLPASVRQLLFEPTQSSTTVRANVQTATDAAPVS